LAPTATPVEKYTDAYEKARYYHSTNTSAIGGIKEGGLLIGKGGSGFSSNAGWRNSANYNKRTVHLTDARNRDYYSGLRMRPFLPAERVRHDKEIWDPLMRNNPLEERRDLYKDKEDYVDGTWMTGADIPLEAINFGATDDLAEISSDAIFDIIATHWDGVAPSSDQLRELHRQAVRERRLSLPV
jgi:hypothetical protein